MLVVHGKVAIVHSQRPASSRNLGPKKTQSNAVLHDLQAAQRTTQPQCSTHLQQ